MTLVLAWYSKRGSRSVLHIATDSLLTQSGTSNTWSHATKLFRVHPSHSYIAYCDDSFYALSAVAQGIGILSHTEVLATETTTLGARAKALGLHMSQVFATFPSTWGKAATLLLCGHDPNLGGIRAWKIELASGRHQCSDALPNGNRYFALGSGGPAAQKRHSQTADAGSREFFGTLTHVIGDSSVPDVGGVPQHVVLFTRREQRAAPQTRAQVDSTASGINWKIDNRDESTLFGVPLRFASRMPKAIWRTSVLTRDRHLRAAVVRRVP